MNSSNKDRNMLMAVCCFNSSLCKDQNRTSQPRRFKFEVASLLESELSRGMFLTQFYFTQLVEKKLTNKTSLRYVLTGAIPLKDD
jgi:hypothetical protein